MLLDKNIKLIESTQDVSNFKKTYELFENPVQDMDEIEYWEEHLRLLGFHYILVQMEKHYVKYTKVLGYNILTDRPVNKEF